MAAGQLNNVLRQIRRVLQKHEVAGTPDGDLLNRYLRQRDEAAFETLVRRHGPMVLSVCRRVLGNSHDAEDACQATFLVLVRKASCLRSPGTLSNWLYGVAYRTALHAKHAAAKRRAKEAAMAPRTEPQEDIWAELLPILDQELERLPEKYRTAIVLCELQGQSRKEAALHLRCPEGTVASRLVRGRALLAQRLTRHGLPITAAALAVVLPQQAASASMPPALLASTMGAACVFAGGKAVAGALSTKVAALTEGVLKSMLLTKIKTVMAALLVVGVVALGGGLLTHEHVVAQQAKPGQQNETTPRSQAEPSPLAKPAADRHGDPLPAGALARQGSARLTQGGAVASLAFSPDGKLVASCSSPTSCEERTIHLWDVATGKDVASLLADGHVFHLSFSPDGKLVASAGRYTKLRLWDVATGKERCRCGDEDRHVSDMAFSPDSKLLAAISSERDGHFVTLWDTATGQKVRSWKANEKEYMWSIAFAPDGATLATAGADNSLHVWDVSNATERRRIEVDKATGPLAFSPDGKVVALANGNHTIRLWEPATGRELPPLRGHKANIGRLAFSEGGKTLVSASEDRTIRFWDLATAKELRKISADTSDSWVMAFSPDQKVLAVGGFSSMIRLFDTATGKLLHPQVGHTGRVAAVGFLPTGDIVASMAGDRVLRLAETATGKEQHHSKPRPGAWISIPLFPTQKYGAYLQFYQVALSRDSSLVALPGRAKENGEITVGIWEVASDREVGALTGNFGSVLSLAFSPDKKILALACYDKTIRVWDIAAHKEIRRLTGHEGDTLTLDFSPDGKLLASACSDQTARVWDLAMGKELYRLKHDGRVHAVAFSPDGRSLASAGGEHLRENKGDNRVHVWELATGQERTLLRGNHHFVTCLAFVPGGHALALGSSDASVRVWDPLAGKELRCFEGHRGVVSSLAFSLDGRRLASGNTDTTVLIWDTAGLASPSLPAAALKAEECEALWIDLAGADAGRAYRAIGTLAAHAGQTLPFFSKRLAPAKSPDAKHLAALIDDLDSDTFAIREKAVKELQRMHEDAGPALQKAIAQPRSLESRRRIDGLLARLRRPLVASELLQSIRAIEILERIDSHESRKLLQTLAEGAPEAWLTEDARKTLARMEKR